MRTKKQITTSGTKTICEKVVFMSNLSPMMLQYNAVKDKHKDCVLFFRLGDFYEMFFEDALRVSKELELTLTGRDCGLEEKAPMCGVPHHSAEGYIKRLIEKGYKVAICEQMESPAEAKGVVKRDVVRIITPGTITESGFLDETKNNYIACVYAEKSAFSISFADISTGEVYITSSKTKQINAEIINELAKFNPSEILFNDYFVTLKETTKFVKDKLFCLAELLEIEKFATDVCLKKSTEYFGEAKVRELTDDKNMIKSLGALLNYLDYTQKQGAKRIINLNMYDSEQYLSLDLTARRNLELCETMRNKEKKGTLLWVLDKTKTAMGKRLIRKYIEQPLLHLNTIMNRQNAVTELFSDNTKRADLREILSSVFDLERLMTKVVYGTVNPRELKALGQTVKNIPAIKKTTKDFKSTLLVTLREETHELKDIYTLIESAIKDEPPVMIKDGDVVKDGFNAELDELRNVYKNAKGILTQIETDEKEKTGIKNLKIGYNRVFGYYIEVSKGNVHLVPDGYIRKQTLSNCERYITEELKELESKVLTAGEKIKALEQSMLEEIRLFVSERLPKIQATANAIGTLDVLASLAEVAKKNSYVCPDMTLTGTIDIKDGRHPVVEKVLNDKLFVPNDTILDDKSDRISIITGPNMAGKSTYMRQVAIIVIMAQMGGYVPAKSATITVVDKVFTRVGASDDLASGQSTFMVEMNEVAYILKNATSKSLIILDEIGRGTSTFDGMSIARAVVEFVAKTKSVSAKTLFATHYHELTVLEDEIESVKNYNIVAKKKDDDIVFLRKIVRGGADDSYGIEVAKLAGVPNEVIARAKEILAELESEEPKQSVKVGATSEVAQLGFADQNDNEIADKLRNIDPNTLSPIEALSLVYELKKMM